jgi:hypothetical protein
MASMVGLGKEQIRRITLNKLRVVYREWGIGGTPFARTGISTSPGGRRDDPRAFVVALVAALLGGLSEAIERNNRGLAAALTRRPHGRASGRRRTGEPPARAAAERIRDPRCRTRSSSAAAPTAWRRRSRSLSRRRLHAIGAGDRYSPSRQTCEVCPRRTSRTTRDAVRKYVR